jgi:hypothetical protein
MKSKSSVKKELEKAQEEVAAASESVLDKAVKAVEKKAAKKATKKSEKSDSVDEKASAKSSEKEAAKKASTKKTIDTKVVFQLSGSEIETKSLLEQAKADFIAAGGKEKEIKAMELYIKPEENAAYYVVNGVPLGKIAIFA